MKFSVIIGTKWIGLAAPTRNVHLKVCVDREADSEPGFGDGQASDATRQQGGHFPARRTPSKRPSLTSAAVLRHGQYRCPTISGGSKTPNSSSRKTLIAIAPGRCRRQRLFRREQGGRAEYARNQVGNVAANSGEFGQGKLGSGNGVDPFEVVERNIEQLLFKRDDDFVYVSTERVVPTAQKQTNEASAQTRANDRQTTARFSMDVTWTRPNSDCLRQIQRNRSPTVQPGSFPDYRDHPQNKHLRHARHEEHRRRSPQTRSPYVTNRRPRRKPPHGFHILLQVKTKSEFLRLLLHIIDESCTHFDINTPFPDRKHLEPITL
ncbi:hypothetical protein pipiens_015962 [Culex pipiens pipiens]|uniref:Uncharacterized protein n=1 Tax=Culex pipiens pipiens TaxID=38569 RepID=A0ABD1CN91_CULPP